MLYSLKLSNKSAEETKNVFCAKGESWVDHSAVIKWFKKLFCSSWKNLDNWARSGGPKSVDSEAEVQAVE